MVRQLEVLLREYEEIAYAGHSCCSGCGLAIAFKLMMSIMGRNSVLVIPPSCAATWKGVYPYRALKIPMLSGRLTNCAAVASGVSVGLKTLGKTGINVIAWVGDGGTGDIGLQALSGAAERNDNIIYVCYDNEAYMNTGGQKSGTTPYGAITMTTAKGKKSLSKNVPLIIAAHNVPYVATLSISYPLDFLKKAKKAKGKTGLRYLHIQVPCPTGWGFSTKKTVEIGRLAVKTGMWTLYEIESGKKRITHSVSRRKPVVEYLAKQARFRNLSQEDMQKVQDWIDMEKSPYMVNKEG